MRKIIIAIDGSSACGKSSTAKLIADELKYTYIDSGAMYRAVTLFFNRNHIKHTNPKEVRKALNAIEITFRKNEEGVGDDTYLNGLNVEKEIRKMYISEKVSEVSAISEVRTAMVAQQRKLGKSKGIVMDGRDIGSVVFPEAELKIFMTAEFYIRAERRQAELLEKGELVGLEKVMDNLKKRDHIDSTRDDSPLFVADDAVTVDTTHLTMEEQVDEIMQLITSKIIEVNDFVIPKR
ncbi:MAG: (d)CMP kinase [Cyclobacteriaceae bacterium]|nr:(d)CMP kinase [Cyclobacteriaceae bacterium]